MAHPCDNLVDTPPGVGVTKALAGGVEKPSFRQAGLTQTERTMPSKWHNPEHQAYWNRVLKEDGLETVKGRQVFDRKKWKATGDARATQRARRSAGGRAAR